MSVNTGTGWDFLDNFNTGGKYHKIWETFEDVGRGVRDAKLKNLENSPPAEQKQKQDEYKKAINTPESQLEQSSSNMTPWLVGGGILLLVLGGS